MANTWNPFTIASSVTLSGGDLIATATSNNETGNLKGLYVVPAGGGYFEITSNPQGNVKIGICTPLWDLLTKSIWQNSPYSVAYELNNGKVWKNGVTLSTIQLATAAQINCFAVSSTHIWIRKQSGNWNNNALADPATGVGGIAHGLTGFISANGCVVNNGDKLTAAFASGSWTYSPPAGFGELEFADAESRVSQQFAVVAHLPDVPLAEAQARVSQQYIIVAHSSTPMPPSGAFRYHQPIINLDDGP